jgi:hypothetical protein
MIYFYDKLDLILFVDSIEDTKYYDNYKKYITDKNLNIDFYTVEDKKKGDKKDKDKKDKKQKTEKYNAFLMSSIQKSSRTVTFNIKRLNHFLGRITERSSQRKIPNLDDINISKQLRMKSSRIRKVLANMLPVGHLLSTSNELAVPKLYSPDIDPEVMVDVRSKLHPWTKVYDIPQDVQIILFISKGSCAEVRSMLILALELNYINKEDFDEIYNLSIEIMIQLEQ